MTQEYPPNHSAYEAEGIHSLVQDDVQASYRSMPKLPENLTIPSFLDRASYSIRTAESHRLLNDTRVSRILRKFSIREVCEFVGVERGWVAELTQRPDGPDGEIRGRERVFSVDDIMRLRAIAAAKPESRKEYLFWREPNTTIPVIVVGSQKGGSGKSVTAANLSQYLHLYYGMRVGIIDADPQATASLYFSDSNIDVGAIDQETFINFMGLSDPGKPAVLHNATTLDRFWKKTPWPGLRLMPGGPAIQEGDISLFFVSRQANQNPDIPPFHSMLRTAIERYQDAYPPVTRPEDLMGKNGLLNEEAYERALYETLDVIIIDCAPSLSLAMLNTIVAATSICVPTPLKGFDLSTLTVYLSSAADMVDAIMKEANIHYPEVPSLILPTIVSQQTDTDLRVLKSLMDHDPEVFCPVFYSRSEAVANAAELYQSLYEYVPTKGKKRSTDNFLKNANAVNDALVSRFLPHLPPRGFANEFIADMYGGTVQSWTEDEE